MSVPFQLLHTFIVVARCGRMNIAAKTLAVTPGAISQRIKDVEATVGYRLLERSPQGVALTRAGQRLFDRVNGPFGEIEAGYAASAGRARQQRITINTVPSLASNWLVPRLSAFQAAYPKIEIAIECDTRLIDLGADSVDLAIRHGLGSYPGLESHWLMAPAQIVVASPHLLNQGRPIAKPQDCLAYPLLHDIELQDWECWLRGLGLKCIVPRTGPAYSDDNLLIRAAIAGQGLALVADTYAAEEIAAGRLVQAFCGRWPTRFAYYLVGLPATFRRSAIQRFKSWLIAEAGQSG